MVDLDYHFFSNLSFESIFFSRNRITKRNSRRPRGSSLKRAVWTCPLCSGPQHLRLPAWPLWTLMQQIWSREKQNGGSMFQGGEPAPPKGIRHTWEWALLSSAFEQTATDRRTRKVLFYQRKHYSFSGGAATNYSLGHYYFKMIYFWFHNIRIWK